MRRKLATICSGIGTAELAGGEWFDPLWAAEIEPFPSAVLAVRHPSAANLGDMTAPDFMARARSVGTPDVLVAGTPCQSFSVAGLRRGMSDERGNLTLRFVDIVEDLDDGELVVLWENVSGVLSDRGNAFGCLLAGLAGESAAIVPHGGRWTDAGLVAGPRRAVAWRVLDAQYFGLAQRRRRVFVIASGRKGLRPEEILFEWESRRRDSAPSREAGQGVAAALTRGAESGGRGGAAGRRREGDVNLVPALTASGRGVERTGESRGQDPLVVVDGGPTSASGGSSRSFLAGPVGVTIHGTNKTQKIASYTDVAGSLRTKPPGSQENSSTTVLECNVGVRRLMPVECERLQGLPDGYTDVEFRGRPASDSARYRANGNGMAEPCVRWILGRIAGALNEEGDER